MTDDRIPTATDTRADAKVSVRDLLNVPALGLRLMAAPQGADVTIRWAHPTELLDPTPYLAGGELVLTVGASLQADGRCREFVQNLLIARVSALAYGVGDVTAEIPEALIEECRARQLPLLRVPPSVPFRHITEMIANRRALAMAAPGRHLQRLVVRLLEAIATGRDLVDLQSVIDDELGGRVTFGAGLLEWEPVLDSDVRPARETLEHLGRVLAVRKHEEDNHLAHRRREVGRLVELVAQGRADAEVLRHPLTQAGVDTDGPIVPVAWPQGAAPLLVPISSGCLLTEFGGVTMTFANDTDQVAAAAAESRLPCGIGEPAGLEDLHRVISPALTALNLARNRGAIVSYEELVTFEGLLEQLPTERVAPFAERLIDPLSRSDRELGTALLPTLRVFMSVDGKLNDAAAKLFLHPNSLRNRLKRIAELSGADPRSFQGRATLAIGLWAWDRRPGVWR